MSLAAVDKEQANASSLVQVPALSSENHPKRSLLLPMRCLRTGSYRFLSTLSPAETREIIKSGLSSSLLTSHLNDRLKCPFYLQR